VLTLYELARTQRREFPDHVPWHDRAVEWARRKLRPHQPKVAGGSAHVTAGATISASGEAIRKATTIEERVARLEGEMKSVRQRQGADRKALEGRIQELGRRIEATAESLAKQLDEQEARRKENLRESLLFERIGVALFLTGIALTVLGNAV
jgi:hypothetical protein